ncbi:MAG: glycosyltransferase [Acidimicrobiia bacterium]|nr:glycosyltransferase [Acidimicrobiia bacterium]
MKVLNVINSLSGSGGAEHGLVREITAFDSSAEQMVVSLYGGGTLESRLLSAGIEHRWLGLQSSRSGRNWPLGVARLRSVIRQFKPDVVHSSLFSGNLVAQLATRYASGRSIPILSTMTLSGDLALHRSLQPGAGSWYAGVLRGVAGWAARGAHVWFRALTNDAAVTNCIALGVDPERVVVIPRGVPSDLVPITPLTRDRLGLPRRVPIILNVGRQAAQKGQTYLLAALAELIRDVPAHLVILGRRGDATHDLERAVEAFNLSDHVSIIDYTDQVGDFLANADVFAFPSLMEGLGTSVAEAMVAGVQVVAFDIPPVREITGDGRYADLVPVGDVAEFTLRIKAVLEADEVTESRVQEAQAWARERFDLSRVAHRVRTRLEQLASGVTDSR